MLQKIFNPYRIIQSIVAIGLAAMLFSCKNDMQDIRSLDFVDTLPDISARDIEMLYSERGNVQVKLISTLLIRNNTEEDGEIMEFPEGFEVLFYDSTKQVKSTISADYGIHYEKDNLMIARYNVVVENLEKKERLNTEELYWDQKKQKIYTDKFVKLTRGEEVITGDGLTSDQEFEVVEIHNARGLLQIDESEDEEF